jgi:hypothetical protein
MSIVELRRLLIELKVKRNHRAYVACAAWRRRLGCLGMVFARRAVALALAALWVVATTSALVHRSALDHARCVEHGELVHAEGQGGGALVGAGDGATALWDTPAAESGHEHCVLHSTTRPRLVNPAPAVAVLTLEPAGRAHPVHSAERPPTLLPYRVAPKTSPPA